MAVKAAAGGTVGNAVLDGLKDDPLRLAALGIVFFREKNYPQAQRYFRRATDLRPDDQCILTYHAACLAMLGQKAAARTTFEKAIALDRGSQDADQARKWLASLQGQATIP